MKNPLLCATLLLALGRAVADPVFADDHTASAYDHDRVGAIAGEMLLEVCGDQEAADAQAALERLDDWSPVADALPPGVLVREHRDFAGQPGLMGRFRIGRHSCTLTLAPYLPNARAGDELVYGVSEAAARAFGDAESGLTPEQTVTGLHRIDPDGHQHQQVVLLQWLQRGGVPLRTYFAVFDMNPERPRVILGRRDFNGRVVFGMADSTWERRTTAGGKAILAIQGPDPVDPRSGGYNTVAISRNAAGGFEVKAWLPIGRNGAPFRLRPSLGTDPLEGFDRLTIAARGEGALHTRTVPVRAIEEIRAKTAMLGRGVYPVYLELQPEAVAEICRADVFTFELKREGGSGLHLQVPAGETLCRHLRDHLGYCSPVGDSL